VSEVVFYKLSSKFLDSSRDVPESSRDVMYYALAVGHHTGVIDCFSEALRCRLDDYRAFCGFFHDDTQAYYKLTGVERNGEIQLDKSHLALFEDGAARLFVESKAAAQAFVEPPVSKAAVAVLETFYAFLNDIRANSGLYLMIRLMQLEPLPAKCTAGYGGSIGGCQYTQADTPS
jgi:hypothetical protein